MYKALAMYNIYIEQPLGVLSDGELGFTTVIYPSFMLPAATLCQLQSRTKLYEIWNTIFIEYHENNHRTYKSIWYLGSTGYFLTLGQAAFGERSATAQLTLARIFAGHFFRLRKFVRSNCPPVVPVYSYYGQLCKWIYSHRLSFI